jgi:hypothetical protein
MVSRRSEFFWGGELMVLLRFFSCAGFREAVFDPLFGSR